MKAEGETLTFEAAEADELLTLIASYVKSNKPRLSQLQESETMRLWRIASDFSMLQTTKTWMGEQFTFSHFTKVQQCYSSRALAITAGDCDKVSIPDARRLFSRIADWGTVNLRPDPDFYRDTIGKVLVSEFELLAVSRELGSTNESLAKVTADGLVQAGCKAVEWLVELSLSE